MMCSLSREGFIVFGRAL